MCANIHLVVNQSDHRQYLDNKRRQKYFNQNMKDQSGFQMCHIVHADTNIMASFITYVCAWPKANTANIMPKNTCYWIMTNRFSCFLSFSRNSGINHNIKKGKYIIKCVWLSRSGGCDLVYIGY